MLLATAVTGGWKSNANNAIKILLFLHLFACKFSYCLDEGGRQGQAAVEGEEQGGGVASSLATHSRDLFGHNLIQLAHYFISSSPVLPALAPSPLPTFFSKFVQFIYSIVIFVKWPWQLDA